jgi:parvulin-like peptidyl-prolyl isomerase
MTIERRLPLAALATLLALGPCVARAQTLPGGAPREAGAPDESVDRVVAVVGDSAIFYSELQEEILRRQAAQMPMPERQDSVAFRAFERAVLNDLVDQTLVLSAAARDTTVAVPQARVDETFDQAWQDEIRRFGSEAELRRALEAEGRTLAQYRAMRREEVEQTLLLQTYVQSQRQGARIIPIEESQIRAYYEAQLDTLGSLGQRPETITFEMVVLAPRASDSIQADARAEAERIRSMLDEGQDFAELARRFSDDPGSAPSGGELGWIRRGMGFAQEFEDAAFRLGRGQISDVVETQFGAHIIQVERINGAERLVRHILIAATPAPADESEARERASAIRDEVLAGAPLSDFADEGEDTGIPNPATVSRDQLGQLPPELAQALGPARSGDVLGPIELHLRPDESAFAVLRVQEVREAGELTYDDVHDQIRSILQDRQFQDQLLDRLRAGTYIDVRL